MTPQRSTLRNVVAFGILCLLMTLSFLSPWSEIGAIAKQLAFPAIAGVVGALMLSGSIPFRLSVSLSAVLFTGASSGFHSNGFDWRMDQEWDLFGISLGFQGGFSLVGFASACAYLRSKASPNHQVEGLG